MKVYRHVDKMAAISRQRRWTVSDKDPTHRFYDFRARPELIPTVLEDFSPFGDQPAVREFYSLLTNMNGPQSQFETNDSAFKGPHPNTSPGTSPLARQISGRVMFYFREVPLNTSREYVEWLEEGIHFYLKQLTPEFTDGVVGTSVMKMHLPELGTEKEPADGFELCLHFWSWGDSDDQTWDNLHIVMRNLQQALAALSQDAEEQRYLKPTGA